METKETSNLPQNGAVRGGTPATRAGSGSQKSPVPQKSILLGGLDPARRLWPTIVGLYAFGLAAIVGVLFLSLVTGRPAATYTRDPTAVMRVNPFTGVLSNIGVLLWCAAASICLFAALRLRRRGGHGELGLFLLASGLLTSLLLLDDFFLLHEYVFPRLFHIEEESVYWTYALILLAYLGTFRKLILRTDFILLFLALGFFGVSTAMDRLVEESMRGYFLLEDGSKLLGILSWLGYLARVSLHAVEAADSRPMLSARVG